MAIPFFDSPYRIYEGKFWNVILNGNQSYLGRCIVYLASREIEDVLVLTEDERSELWDDLLPRLDAALKKAFAPDRLNYTHLANTVHFVHWHIVPRYEKNPVREFVGEIFRDERVGKHYAPAPEKPLPEETLEKICTEIKKNFV